MNKIDKNPNYKEMYDFIVYKFNKTNHFNSGPYDETFYSLRTYESAKEIINKLNKKIKKEQLLTACILHDIGKVKLKYSKLFSRKGPLRNIKEEWDKHPLLGIPLARNFLKKQGHSPEFIKEVLYLIEHHDKRTEKINKTIELKILQDADLIADIGFAGFIRPFLYAGKFNSRTTINSIKFLQTEDRIKSGEKLNLNISKLIARREMNIQKNLVKEISNDIKSDLI